MPRVMYEHLVPKKSPKEMLPTAPRYFTKLNDSEFGRKISYKKWFSSLPYKEKDVVLIEQVNPKGKPVVRKAFIVHIYVHRDEKGERVPKFQVLVETNAGTWSKSFKYIFSGTIYRGYRRAGKIPDYTLPGVEMDRD